MNLVEAIEFPVIVNGEPLVASVIEVDENPAQHSYRIQFSNGYEDIFTLDDGMIEADKGETSKSYIKAIRNDISNVIGLDTNKFYYIFQDKLDGIIINIWIIEKEDEKNETYYAVYYNERYRFELRKVNEQYIYSTRSKQAGIVINEDIAKKASQILYSLV